MAMTLDEQRIAIAEKCGTAELQWKDGSWFRNCPDYPNDFNAMHEAEKIIPNYNDFMRELSKTVGGSKGNMIHATAAQRAEAFCRVFWPERFE